MRHRFRASLATGLLASALLLIVSGCLLWPEDEQASLSDKPFTVGGVTFPNDSATARAFMTSEPNGRLSAFLEKCTKGTPVTLGFVGGSITAGGRLQDLKNRYSDVFASYLRHDYPGLTVKVANAGLSATGSRYAATRAKFQLFPKKPDLIVVEFAINDVGTASEDEIRASMEGLVRQCLKVGPEVAVILLFTPKPDGFNVQNLHSEVGAHYNLPMISYRNAVSPLINDGRLKFDDLFVDDPHPNTSGHRIMAQLLHAYLKRAATQSGGTTGVEIPAPRFTDLFERTGLAAPGDTAITAVTAGWRRFTRNASGDGPTRYAYQSTRVGQDTLTLKTHSREITLGLHMQTDDTSSVKVYVDGQFYSATNNYYVIEHTRLIRLPIASTTALRTIQIIQSGANRFTVDYVLYAGTPD